MSLEKTPTLADVTPTEPLPVIDSGLQKTTTEKGNDNEKSLLDRPKTLVIGSLVLSLVIQGAVNIGHISENVAAATDHSPLNNTLSEIASEINDYGLRVDCDTAKLTQLDEEIGDGSVSRAYVHPLRPFAIPLAPPVMTVREDLCEIIADGDPASFSTYADDQDAQLTYSTALYTLLHEGEHTKQVFNEAEASCHAIQKLPDALVEVGVQDELADYLAQDVANYLADNYSEAYLSEECAPGGSYDLELGSIYLDANDKTS